jgi:cytochrome c biogenesis protein CcmG/thiol:disulfide interchange protein DsbE
VPELRALRPSFLIPVIAFLLLAGVFALHLSEISSGKNISDLPSALIGKATPKIDLPPVEGSGKGLTSKQIKGKVALINIWASWCPPCRTEHPLLMRLASEGVALYGINYKDRPEAALAFLAELGNPFQALGADRAGRASIDWGVYGYPETFVVDKKGTIRYRHVGPIQARDLDAKIYPLLKQLKAEKG